VTPRRSQKLLKRQFLRPNASLFAAKQRKNQVKNSKLRGMPAEKKIAVKMTKKELKSSITSASTRNVDAGQKSCEKPATFLPAPIPSLADGAARRPVTTCRSAIKKKKN